MNALIYDIEIKKAVPMRKEPKIEGIEYCDGWHDHANMGISCVGVYDYADERYRVFMDDNMAGFAALCERRDVIVSFNGLAFDNRVMAANGIVVPNERSYDLLVELWRAAGLAETFQYPSHMGFGLDATCERNFGVHKSGNGALAPVLYQRKQFGELIDYCLNDVALTKRLFDAVMADAEIKDPRGSSVILKLQKPQA